MKAEDLKLVFQFFTEIGIINQLSTAQLERQLPLGLKISQFSVLNHLIRLGDNTTPARLASAFQVSKGAMTNNLDRLLQNKLIRITPDETDGRVKRVFITEKGKKIREKAIESMFVYISPMLKQISIKDFDAALPFLTQLRSYLDQQRN